MSEINEGEAFVAGRSAENAKALLKAADEAGLDRSVVRTSSRGGYIVPEALAEAVGGDKADDESDEKPKTTTRRTRAAAKEKD